MNRCKTRSALMLVGLSLTLTLTPALGSRAHNSTNAGQSASSGSSETKGTNTRVESGARIFIATMDGGFDISLSAAILKKQVPVLLVTDRTKADYEVSGISMSDKAGWAKMLFLGTDATNEQASIKVVNLKTGEVAFGYNVKKENSARGRQSAAEACAKHLKENILGK